MKGFISDMGVDGRTQHPFSSLHHCRRQHRPVSQHPPGVPQGMLTRTTSAPMLGSARAKDLPSKAFLLARTACCHHCRKPVPASRPHTSQAPPLVPWRATTLGSTSDASQKPAPVLLTSNPNAPPGAVCNKVHEKKPT